MLNTPEFYTDLGNKAGTARNQKDEARARFHAEHFRKAKELEQSADKVTADQLYRSSYLAARVGQ